MGTTQYRLGRAHGLAGIRHMAHRRLRPYDSRSAQVSYNNGYAVGATARREQGRGGMDYTQPLNCQQFIDKGGG